MLFFSCIAKILELINTTNHAPVIHNTKKGEPIHSNIKIITTNDKYEIICDFIVKNQVLTSS